MEPLSGYLTLAEKLYTDGKHYAGSWNFGPHEVDAKPVAWIAERLSNGSHNLRWTERPRPNPMSRPFCGSIVARLDLSWGGHRVWDWRMP